MPYLLKTKKNEVFLIDYNNRNGLHYRIITKKNTSRASNILQNATEDYTATIDENNQIHVLCKNTKNQILHFQYKSEGFNRKVILDDSNNLYNISNLRIVSLKDKLHLFYTAKSLSHKGNELIHHILHTREVIPPQSLASLPNLFHPSDYIVHKNRLFFLMVKDSNSQYCLELKIYDETENSWISHTEILTSQFPITHCKLCIQPNGIYHMIYVQERYGQYHMYYKKNEDLWSEDFLLHISSYPIQPTLFLYHDALWINWEEKQKAKMILSIDSGETLSSPMDCSLQSDKINLYHYCYPFSPENKELICNQLYGVDGNYPRFFILSQIDMDDIHMDTISNTELDLYITGLRSSMGSSPSSDFEAKYRQLEEENIMLKDIQENIIQQYESTSALAKKIQEEGKRWKNKYFDMEQKIKIYENQIRKLKSELESKNKMKSSIHRDNLPKQKLVYKEREDQNNLTEDNFIEKKKITSNKYNNENNYPNAYNDEEYDLEDLYDDDEEYDNDEEYDEDDE